MFPAAAGLESCCVSVAVLPASRDATLAAPASGVVDGVTGVFFAQQTAAALAEAGKRVIILEAGSYYNESDFVQSEVAAYQNLFLRGGFFPSADGMVSIAAGSTGGLRARPPIFVDEGAGRLQAAVEIEHGNQRFQRVGAQINALAPVEAAHV